MEGNPGNRRRRAGPQPRRKITPPDPPSYLGPMARRIWNETAPGLAEQGMLALQDTVAFAAYCTAVVDWIAARKRVDRLRDLTMKMPGGSRQQAAEIGILNRAEEVMWRRGEQFGLNGRLNRDRMGVTDPTLDGDDTGGLLSKAR